jgi:glutathione S-transferase
LWKPNTPDGYKPIVRENLARRFDYLDGQLDGRDYLAGAGFTIADAYCFTILNWTNLHDIDLSRWPNLKAYVGRVAARPKVQEAMRAEGLLK